MLGRHMKHRTHTAPLVSSCKLETRESDRAKKLMARETLVSEFLRPTAGETTWQNQSEHSTHIDGHFLAVRPSSELSLEQKSIPLIPDKKTFRISCSERFAVSR